MILQNSETQLVKSFLMSGKHSLIASEINLIEFGRIPESKSDLRGLEISNVVRLATRFRDFPCSYVQSMELIRELRRIRPDWLRPFKSKAGAKKFLRSHNAKWQDALKGTYPSSFEKQKRLNEEKSMQPQILAAQREWRQGPERNYLQTHDKATGDALSKYLIKSADAKWREDRFVAWEAALRQKHPFVQDYIDYAAPYIRDTMHTPLENAIEFWLFEADANNMPHNRAVGLTWHYQTNYQIDSGNPYDVSHSHNLIDVDFFVTCDKNFYKVLSAVSRDIPNSARPLFLKRKSHSACEQLITLEKNNFT